ncbi:RNA-binding protein Hfq [Candidatus Hepatincola sp. Pdp]
MKQMNNQDLFLNTVRKSKVPVTVFLSNGVKLQGIIISFDIFSILLKRDAHIQLIYKHSVSTIMPNSPISLKLEDVDDESAKPLITEANKKD